MNFDKLAQQAFATAKAHGWHDEKLPDETYLMLIITEIVEAVQADRKDMHADVESFNYYYEDNDDGFDADGFIFKAYYDDFIKNTVEDELSDIIIRCLDYSALRGIGLDRVPSYVASYSIDKSIAKRDFPTFAYFLTFKAVNGDVEDVLARVIAYCKLKGIDIDFFVWQKMRYNKLREFKHGNKKY